MAAVEILVIGDELLRGEVLEKNAWFLSRQLTLHGNQTSSVRYVSDNNEAIKAAILDSKAEFILCCGGLGPTSDDITRQAVAEAAGASLELNEEARQKLVSHAKERGREFHEISLRQAWFPAGSEIIKNPEGTAEGFMLFVSGKRIICLPGVPSEVQAMWEAEVSRLLPTNQPASSRVYTVFGHFEVSIGSRLEGRSVRYMPGFPYIRIVVENQEDAAALEEAVGKDSVLGEGAITLPEFLHEELLKRKLTVASAESCTAGILASLLTDNSGSSGYFYGGIVSYANSAKISQLGVSESVLEAEGAVSKAVALEMSKAVKDKFGVDYGLSTTGIAGPGGGSPEKPVGTVWLGICGPDVHKACLLNFSSSRDRIRKYSAHAALDLLRRDLLGYNIPEILGNR